MRQSRSLHRTSESFDRVYSGCAQLDNQQRTQVLFVAFQTVAILRSGTGQHESLLNTVQWIICGSWSPYILSCSRAECCPLGIQGRYATRCSPVPGL